MKKKAYSAPILNCDEFKINDVIVMSGAEEFGIDGTDQWWGD